MVVVTLLVISLAFNVVLVTAIFWFGLGNSGPVGGPVALELIRDVLSIVSWPVVVLIIVAILMLSNGVAGRVGRLFGGFRSIKFGPGGAEFVLSEEGAKEAERTARETFEGYRREAVGEFEHMVKSHELREKLGRVLKADGVLEICNLTAITDFRCTVHVPDVVFADLLYQITDYYPRGKGAGRLFSIRYGNIGRAWRLVESQIGGSVTTDPKKLIREWGMTQEEAEGADKTRQSFASIILRDKEDSPVGIFHMDAPMEKVFGLNKGAEAKLQSAIVLACEKHGLTVALSLMRADLLKRAPLIKLDE